MAFDVSAAGGYGNGTLGNVTASGIINSYASITVSGNKFSFANFSQGTLNQTFAAGEQVFLWEPTTGSWLVATIISVDGSNVTTDKSLSGFTQAVIIPQFNNLTVSGTIKPLPFANGRGGIVVVKCAGTFTLNGNVDLTDASTSFSRSLTSQESNGTLDRDLYSGCENSITKDSLLLSVGDGAVFILAKIFSAGSSAKIGNPSFAGVQYCRGASDSFPSHSGTNIGGSSIFIAAETFNGFKPALIAKYRQTEGTGLGRCYIATNSALLHDEGLYALDVISDKFFLRDELNIRDFGNGSNRTFNSNENGMQLNSYATVNSISGKNFNVTVQSGGYADLKVGALVMIHQTAKNSGSDYDDGKFKIGRITAINDNVFTLDTDFPTSTSSYYVQIISIPQFTSFKGKYKGCPRWDNGYGGICAFACSELFYGSANVEGKGTFSDNVNPAVGNAFMRNRLPIGQGHGSVFILAKELKVVSGARIGATYSGAGFGGKTQQDSKGGQTPAGGYRGADGAGSGAQNGFGGHGGAGGTNDAGSTIHYGGWHSNAPNHGFTNTPNRRGFQGAHVFIVADTLTDFRLAALSTGGDSGSSISGTYWISAGQPGGAGYGGGGAMPGALGANATVFPGAGGYHGGGSATTNSKAVIGGGSAGAAFIYCNNAVNQSTDGIIIS